MSDIIKKLKNRLPGSIYYEHYSGTKFLKGSEWDFLYRIRKEQYYHGVSSERAEEVLKEGVDARFKKGDVMDFGFMTIPYEHFSSIDNYWLLLDLVLPYLVNSSAICGAEATYEEFGLAVKKNDIVIDAGANYGFFTAYAAKCRGAEVHAFEPIDEVAEALKKTIDSNGISDRVFVVKKALGDYEHEAEIAVTDNSGTNTLVPVMEGGQHIIDRRTIKVTTIDQYVLNNSLNRVDFIKADIEGSERDMLAGAVNVMSEFKPQLAICTYHLPDDVEVLTNIIKSANPSYEINYGEAKLYAK